MEGHPRGPDGAPNIPHLAPPCGEVRPGESRWPCGVSMRERLASAAAAVDPVLVIVAVVWGCNFVVLKDLLEVFTPAALLLIRYVGMCVLLLAVLRGWRRPAWPRGRDWLPLVIVAFLGLGVQQLAFMNGLHRTGSAEGALLLSTAPIWATVLAAALRDEQIVGVNWLGIGLGFVGVGLVLLGGAGSSGPEGSHLPGNLLVLTAGVLYGAYAVLSRPLMRKHGALQVITLSMCVSCLLFIPAGGPGALSAPWGELGWRGWAALAYLTLPAGAYGFVVWYSSIDRHGPSKTMAYQYLVPVAALIAGVTFRDERVTWVQWIGAAVTLVGIGLARWRPAPQKAGVCDVAGRGSGTGGSG